MVTELTDFLERDEDIANQAGANVVILDDDAEMDLPNFEGEDDDEE